MTTCTIDPLLAASAADAARNLDSLIGRAPQAATDTTHKHTPGHTPGPWKIKRSGCISDADGELIATTGYRVRVGSDEDDANARLIAAAPDLLEAARAALAELDACRSVPEAISDGARDPHDLAALRMRAMAVQSLIARDLLRAAIAKAEQGE